MKLIIVGTGPAGLYFAIQFIHLNIPNSSILMIDKRNEYTRKQIISYDEYNLPDFVVQYASDMTTKQTDIATVNNNIEIRYLEKIMRLYLQSFDNILFVHDNVIDVYADKNIVVCEKDQYRYDVLIAADGPSSTIRTLLDIPIIYLYDEPFYACTVFVKNKINKTQTFHINGIYLTTPYGISSFSFNISAYDYEHASDQTMIELLLLSLCNEIDMNQFEILDIIKVKIDPNYATVPNIENIFLIGDALMTTHYFTGKGLANAFSYIDYLIANNFVVGFNLNNELLLNYIHEYVEIIMNDIDESIIKIRNVKCGDCNNHKCKKIKSQLNKSPLRFD